MSLSYGYFCSGWVFGLVYLSVQHGLIGLLPLLALLVFLVLQHQCLFGRDRHPGLFKKSELNQV